MIELSRLELSRLPPKERAKRYRELAREDRLKAAQCVGDIQTALIKSAGEWAQLTLEAESEVEGKSGTKL